jgi:putative flavoprotein involved in K+ transport
MRRVTAIIIGAGQAGLAMSHCLTIRGVEHLVLERGRTAERWYSERWDSLRLLTPNWMSRLPGWSYRGDDPDGFMSVRDFARYLEAYAQTSRAPIESDTSALSVRRTSVGYLVDTNRGARLAQVVVIATGYCDIPAVPAMAQHLEPSTLQITPATYRNPEALPKGGVLVVGASATGLQLAEEIQCSGRPVILSVGRHTRLPRQYRGRDIWWWLDRSGVLDETFDNVADRERALRQPAFQLIGGPDHRTLDLAMLRNAGVRLVGRAVSIDGHRLHLLDDLAETTEAAQQALERLLDRIDRLAGPETAPPEPDASRVIGVEPTPTALDLKAESIRTVVWATGYHRNYSWLHAPIFDGSREIIHRGGVTPMPGLYVLGLRFMRRRRSNFIDGVGLDAEALAEHVLNHLARPDRSAA